MHDETLPGMEYKQARFCSMCHPEFCAMNVDADARERRQPEPHEV